MKNNKHNRVENPVDNKKRGKFSTAQKIGAVIILMLLLLCLRAFTPFGINGKNSANNESNTNGNEITCAADLEGKKAGSLVGSACLEDAQRLVGSTGQALGFNTTTDVFQALLGNKIDASVLDGPLSIYTSNVVGGTKVLDDVVSEIQYGAIFSKTSTQSQQIKNEFNTFLAGFKAEGKLDEMWNKWLSADDSLHTVDYSQITGEKGELQIPTSSSTGAPSVYVRNGELVGMDIDLAVAFCSYAGYKPVFKDMAFDSIIMSISTNKYKISLASFTITPERAQSVDFSDPYYDGGCLITAKSGEDNNAGFLSSFISGFKKTFIDENRWEMFLKGSATTFVISICALLFGTLLGLLVFLICHRGGKWTNKITDGCIWILKGMPVVVLLMILFYIVFGKSAVDGVFVSIVAFTLLFGAVTIGLLRTGLDAIDEGQREAGLALGYSESQTFIKIILPQAIRHMLPSYESEAVELLKGTAIVGYIAVQDLTKVGDIIRSATYDAIFPLLAVAFLYFVLEALFKVIIRVLDKILYQRKRKNEYILKGIKSIDVESDEGQNYLEKLLHDTQDKVYECVANDDVLHNATDEKIVEFQHVKKSYDGKSLVLTDINCDIYKGDVITLIGGSGCGKSTLIRCLNFLDPPSDGKIWLDGQYVTEPGFDVTKIRKKVGTIFQRWNLFDHWTVVENVMNPLIDLLGESKQEAYDRAVRALTILGLGSKIMKYPHELSGGQQQRVAIARTMVMRNDVVVLDEPTSALDPCTVTEVAVCMRYFAMQGKTLIIVTHDMDFVRSVCNRIFFICDGTIYEQGTPAQIFDEPQKEQTKVFVNQVLSQELDVDKYEPDIPGTSSAISDFCMKHRISKEIEEKIQKVLFRSMANVFSQFVKEGMSVKCRVCYAQKTQKAYLEFKYSGKEVNLLSSDYVDDNTLNFIKDNAQNYTFSKTDDKEYTNGIVINF